MRHQVAGIVSAVALVLSGCTTKSTSEPDVQERTISVSRAGQGTGTVVSAPSGITCGATCSASFAETEGVTLTATPDANSTFAGWSGGCTGTAASCSVAAGASNVSATAQFDRLPIPVSVTLAGTGSGTVTSSPAGITCGTDCTEEFAFGTAVTLTATPAVGSMFDGWSGGPCTGTDPCSLPADVATTVTATFTLQQHTLTVVRSGTGAGTVTSGPAGITCGGDCTEAYLHGATVTLTAVAAGTSTFAGWSGGGCSGTDACTVTMNAATTVTATFTLVQHVLTVSTDGNGSGTVTSSPAGIACGGDCSEAYTQGAGVTLTAAPAVGSSFTGWSGGGCSGTGPCLLTMNAAVAVTATFTIVQHALTVTLAGAGTGAVTSVPAGIACGATCGASYDFGTQITLTASTDAASTFLGWSGAGCSGLSTCVVTMNAAASVTATFGVFTQAWPDAATRFCSDGSDPIACPGGPPGQDGHYALNVPTYFIMAGSVRDQVSGLTWERSPPTTGMNHADATAYCSGLSLDGFSDWRVPTILELVSLIDQGRTVPGFTPSAFPGIPQNTTYWTSTMRFGSATQAYQVGSNYPIAAYALVTEVSGRLVRCVRGTGYSGSYTAAGTTVTDGRTGLMWQSTVAPSTMIWQEALDYCETLSLDGHDDWRLPSQKELLSLVDPTEPSPTISPLFAARPAATFWTSTPLSSSPGTGYVVSFDTGINPTINVLVTAAYSVRCVR